MRKLCTAVTALFVALLLCSLVTVTAVSDGNADANLAVIYKTAINSYGPTPEHIFSEFPIETPYTSPTKKPTYNTPEPTFIVDAPRTRPPEYNLTGADYFQSPDGWQYTLNAEGYATIVGYADKNAVSIVLPDSIGEYRVIAVGDYAFSRKDGVSPFPNLTSVEIPDTVMDVGFGAFYNCEQLAEVTLSNNIVAIAPFVFNGCKKLKKVAIPDGVKTIGYDAFFDCDSLTGIAIPESAVWIDEAAFESCDRLKTVIIPENVDIIKANAFKDCGRLESVTLPAGDMTIGRDVFLGCDQLTLRVVKNSVAHQYAVANKIPFQLIEASTAENQEGTVTFYMKADGKGTSLTRSAVYAAFFYTEMGFDNDDLSSIRINAENVTVKLYEHSEYAGRYLVLKGKGLYNLGDFDFDNLCSSYLITK